MEKIDKKEVIIPKLIHNKEVSIATAGTRMAKTWKNGTVTIQEFVERLSKTIYTAETVDEYHGMPKAERDRIKDCGAFVCGLLKGGRRRKEDVANRSAITLDLDYAEKKTLEIIKEKLQFAFTVYSTHSHKPKKPRLRLIIWPDRAMLPDECMAVSRRIADKVGMEWVDTTTFDTNRLFYFSSTPSDGEVVFYHNDKPFLPVDKVLAAYGENDAWKSVHLWPRSSREITTFDRLLKKQADPLTKTGVIGAFCRIVSIYDALDTYLADVYRKEGDDRYSFIDGTTSNGAVVYQKKFVFSHHGSDPASNQLCNSFDLLRVHKFSHLDDKSKVGSPTNKLPSYLSMMEWMNEIDGVKKELIRSGMGEVTADDFDAFADDNWLELLETTKNGTVISKYSNMSLIIEHDPEIQGTMCYNDFSCRPELWAEGKFVSAYQDKDVRDVWELIERKYNITVSKAIMHEAVDRVGELHSYHPVQEYLESLEWDGARRVETFFIDYLGCEDNAYTREVALCMFSAAVHRIFEPGYKFDSAIVISGAQGIGKTRLIKTLGKDKWYGELSSFDNKIGMEEVAGSWIVEIAELSAMNKQQLEQQKSFISAESTRYRPPYARHSKDFPRQCVFIGSTNRNEYLKDSTGNRRWWPIDCSVKSVDIDKLEKEVNQLWAEAYGILYAQGRRTYLIGEALEIAIVQQKEKMEADEWEGMIESWLNQETYVDRYSTTLGSFEGVLEHRERVCVQEIWDDCLNQKHIPRKYDRNRIAGIMHNIKGWKYIPVIRFDVRYGSQKGWRNTVPF